MRTCECGRPVFGTDKNTGIGYCKGDQWKRTDKKKKTIAPYSNKPKTHKIDFGFDDQLTMFGWLWENAKDEKGYIICKYTGQRLNGFLMSTLYLNCFAHILSKKRYPWFKLNPANVRVVYPGFHKIVDQGTTLDRTNHPGWKFESWDADVERMKIAYAQFKKDNLLA
jgi:hypothetical protein